MSLLYPLGLPERLFCILVSSSMVGFLESQTEAQVHKALAGIRGCQEVSGLIGLPW